MSTRVFRDSDFQHGPSTQEATLQRGVTAFDSPVAQEPLLQRSKADKKINADSYLNSDKRLISCMLL